MTVRLRSETPADIQAIATVHREAFPSDVEARLVDALRDAGHLAISLVAEEGDAIVSHVAFSPVRIDGPDPRDGLGLAPVAVLPSSQRRGIAAALIHLGLARCNELGAPYVVVLGDPHYYSRFGFTTASDLGVGNEYGVGAEFMIMELHPGAIPHEGGVARYCGEFGLFE